MPAQAMKRLARLSLAGFALLAITLFAEARLGAGDAAAQITPQVAGDGTVIFGGTSEGASNDLTVGVGATEDYLISATIPVGGDFYGAGITIEFDSSKVSAFCEIETVTIVGAFTYRMVCNDDVAGQVTVILEGYKTDLSIGMSGTETFGVIEFTGIAETSNAITDVNVTTNCINSDEETITDCDVDFGAVIVGDGEEIVWGDVNCDDAVDSVDISIVVFVAAGGTRPGSCTNPINLNCQQGVDSVDISMVVFIAAGGIINPCNQPAVLGSTNSTSDQVTLAMGTFLNQKVATI